jgi:hypothetical protein
MASDVDAVSAMYDAPMLALREGRVIHLADRTAVREHLIELMAAYARVGAARADIAALDVVALGKSSVFATVHWHVRDISGGLLRDSTRRTTSFARTETGGSCRTRTTTTEGRLHRNDFGYRP